MAVPSTATTTARATARQNHGREITGRHVLIGALSAFAVVLAANVTMMTAAIGSFPGLVAKNSYVASQDFDRRADALARLGWRARIGYADGRLAVAVHDREGRPVRPERLSATVGRPSDARSDVTPPLEIAGEGYAAEIALAPGPWRVALTLAGPDGAGFAIEGRLTVGRDGRSIER